MYVTYGDKNTVLLPPGTAMRQTLCLDREYGAETRPTRLMK